MPPDVIAIEVVREVATLVLLFSVAVMAGRRLYERISYFMLAFAVWDITYYLWLKALLGWPSGILDWDVLFLIPVPWTSPVIAPVIVSSLMLVWALLTLRLGGNNGLLKFNVKTAVPLAVSVCLVLASFLWNAPSVSAGAAPGAFPWPLFAAGGILSIWALGSFVKENAV
jgi:hypothetical protein